MIRLIFIFLGLIICINSYSQFESIDSELLNKFLNSKTYAVIEDNPFLIYNVVVNNELKRNWTITPFDIIKQNEYLDKKSEKGNNFILLEEVYFEKDKSGVKYNFLCFSVGGEFENKKTLKDVFRFPLSYANAEEEEYVYKLPVVIKLSQRFLLFAKENSHMQKREIKEKFFEPTTNLSSKTLYLLKDDVVKDISNDKAFSKYYKYKFAFVDKDELEKIINENTENAVILYKVGPGKKNRNNSRCYKGIIGVDDGRIYYFDYHRINEKRPNALLINDINNLSK